MLASLVILDYQGDVFITVPSSSGLGHRPLTARTGVRVSLGSPIQAADTKTCRFSLFSKAQRVRMFIFKISGFGKFLRTRLCKGLYFSIN